MQVKVKTQICTLDLPHRARTYPMAMRRSLHSTRSNHRERGDQQPPLAGALSRIN